jgi:hypothetical protein
MTKQAEIQNDEVMTPREVAAFLKQRPKFTNGNRAGMCGPIIPFIRVGQRTIIYKKSDVLAWMSSLERNPDEVVV